MKTSHMDRAFPWDETAFQLATRWFGSPLQSAIYRPLLAIYLDDGPFPDIEVELRARVLMSEQQWDEAWARYWPGIKKRFFKVKDGHLRHPIADELRKRLKRKARQKATAGKRGAIVRWERAKAGPPKLPRRTVRMADCLGSGPI